MKQVKNEIMSRILASGRNSLKAYCRGVMVFFKAIFPLHASAWEAVSEPVQKLLEASDTEQENLVKLWHQQASSQLNVICITSTLMGSVIATAFTWPLLEDENSDQKVVLGIWYSALLLALGAIATATQQAVKLARLNTYPDCTQRVCNMLGAFEGQQWRPRKLQLFIWQTPVMLQNGSIYMFLAGLILLIWKTTLENWSMDQLKIIILFTMTLAFTISVYVLTSFGLYWSSS